MKAFRPYLAKLKRLTELAVAEPSNLEHLESVAAALDGQPAKELRSVATLTALRSAGAFFTSSKLAQFALCPVLSSISEDSRICDLACGAGDLLVNCASAMPVQENLAATLRRWSRQLIGRDLHEEFVEAARARLVLSAVRRELELPSRSLPQLAGLFDEIRSGCGLSDVEAVSNATHLVINPPFSMVDTPKECHWTSGKVNAAALFVESCLRDARPGTRLVAILPEVLRCGERYNEWRKIVESQAAVRRIESYGQFDRWADVDVFVLDVEIGFRAARTNIWDWARPIAKCDECLTQHFEVTVGPVVAYRDPHRGPWAPFLTARTVPAWGTTSEVNQHRRFSGRTFDPPVVVVRRTSRRDDPNRAVGTIVLGNNPVAVENHLLVCVPRDGTLRSCRALLRVLRRPETDEWLNRRICCRHLTVPALGELPWWDQS